MLEQSITISATGQDSKATLSMIYGDTGRQIKAKFSDYTIPAGATASISFKRPDNTYYTVIGTITGQDVTFEADQLLTQVGFVGCTLTVTSDNDTISSFPFLVHVEPSMAGPSTTQEGITLMQLQADVETLQTTVADLIASVPGETVLQTAADASNYNPSPVLLGSPANGEQVAPTYKDSLGYSPRTKALYVPGDINMTTGKKIAGADVTLQASNHSISVSGSGASYDGNEIATEAWVEAKTYLVQEDLANYMQLDNGTDAVLVTSGQFGINASGYLLAVSDDGANGGAMIGTDGANHNARLDTYDDSTHHEGGIEANPDAVYMGRTDNAGISSNVAADDLGAHLYYGDESDGNNPVHHHVSVVAGGAYYDGEEIATKADLADALTGSTVSIGGDGTGTVLIAAEDDVDSSVELGSAHTPYVNIEAQDYINIGNTSALINIGNTSAPVNINTNTSAPVNINTNNVGPVNIGGDDTTHIGITSGDGDVAISSGNGDIALTTIDNVAVTASGMTLNGNSVATQTWANSSFLSKNNPTGTGSLSINREANTTIGTNSVAIGSNVTASGRASHAEGYSTTASGFCSHAEGDSTTASDFGSHAEGCYTTASGRGGSHAEGYYTTASGSASHAEGYGTKTSSQAQHAQGKYNVVDSSNVYADIVGNGTADNVRKNIEATTWTGNKMLKGDVYVGCNDDSTGGSKLATEQFVNEKLTGSTVSIGGQATNFVNIAANGGDVSIADGGGNVHIADGGGGDVNIGDGTGDIDLRGATVRVNNAQVLTKKTYSLVLDVTADGTETSYSVSGTWTKVMIVADIKATATATYFYAQANNRYAVAMSNTSTSTNAPCVARADCSEGLLFSECSRGATGAVPAPMYTYPTDVAEASNITSINLSLINGDNIPSGSTLKVYAL